MRKRIVTDPKDKQIIKLETQLAKLEQAVKILSGKVALLERENNRRKAEVTQITSALRRN